MRQLKALTAIVRLALFTLKGGDVTMATVYVTLIVAGRRSFAQVPATLKEAVRTDLEAMDMGHLAA